VSLEGTPSRLAPWMGTAARFGVPIHGQRARIKECPKWIRETTDEDAEGFSYLPLNGPTLIVLAATANWRREQAHTSQNAISEVKPCSSARCKSLHFHCSAEINIASIRLHIRWFFVPRLTKHRRRLVREVRRFTTTM
jgi:hypothetical protein